MGISFASPANDTYSAKPPTRSIFALLAVRGLLSLSVLILGIASHLLSLIFTLNQVVNTHHKVAQSNLLRAKLLFNTSHRLNKPLILLVFFLPLVLIVLICIKFYKLFLKARLYSISFRFFAFLQVLAVQIYDLTQLWPVFSLARLQYYPHNDVFEQIFAKFELESPVALLNDLVALLFLRFFLDVIYWVSAFSFKIAILGN